MNLFQKILRHYLDKSEAKNKEPKAQGAIMKSLPEETLSCYLNIQIDNEGETWVDWGWGEKEVSIEHFADLITRLSTGKMLDELVEIVKGKCIEKDRPELYATFIQNMELLYQSEGESEIEIIKTMEDVHEARKAEMHSPLVKPTEVINNEP